MIPRDLRWYQPLVKQDGLRNTANSWNVEVKRDRCTSRHDERQQRSRKARIELLGPEDHDQDDEHGQPQCRHIRRIVEAEVMNKFQERVIGSLGLNALQIVD